MDLMVDPEEARQLLEGVARGNGSCSRGLLRQLYMVLDWMEAEGYLVIAPHPP